MGAFLRPKKAAGCAVDPDAFYNSKDINFDTSTL
jgi:hypothetical protein